MDMAQESRRAVLLGAGLAGVGVLAGCSTAPVPYDANEQGQAPGEEDTPAVAGNSMGTLLALVTDIPVGGGTIFTTEKVVVTQPVKGEFKAFSAVCTHVGCLCNRVADGTIDCPCHGSEFKITDGAVVTGPAPSPLPTRQITVSEGKILLQ
jgi:Rieske Fe-S protein